MLGFDIDLSTLENVPSYAKDSGRNGGLKYRYKYLCLNVAKGKCGKGRVLLKTKNITYIMCTKISSRTIKKSNRTFQKLCMYCK